MKRNRQKENTDQKIHEAVQAHYPQLETNAKNQLCVLDPLITQKKLAALIPPVLKDLEESARQWAVDSGLAWEDGVLFELLPSAVKHVMKKNTKPSESPKRGRRRQKAGPVANLLAWIKRVLQLNDSEMARRFDKEPGAFRRYTTKDTTKNREPSREILEDEKFQRTLRELESQAKAKETQDKAKTRRSNS